MNDDAKNISIRGRVAYCITCLENAVCKYSSNPSDWKLVLAKLWNFTEVDYLDDWLDEITEYLPDSVLEDGYHESDCEFISENEFSQLYEIYSKSNRVSLDIIAIIFKVATKDFYGRITDHSQETLTMISDLTKLMVDNHVTLPDMNKYKKYSFDEENGWGAGFDGKSLSAIL